MRFTPVAAFRRRRALKVHLRSINSRKRCKKQQAQPTFDCAAAAAQLTAALFGDEDMLLIGGEDNSTCWAAAADAWTQLLSPQCVPAPAAEAGGAVPTASQPGAASSCRDLQQLLERALRGAAAAAKGFCSSGDCCDLAVCDASSMIEGDNGPWNHPSPGMAAGPVARTSAASAALLPAKMEAPGASFSSNSSAFQAALCCGGAPAGLGRQAAADYGQSVWLPGSFCARIKRLDDACTHLRGIMTDLQGLLVTAAQDQGGRAVSQQPCTSSLPAGS